MTNAAEQSKSLLEFIHELKEGREKAIESDEIQTTDNFKPSVIAIIIFGMINCICMHTLKCRSLEIISGLLAIFDSIICREWFRLHGLKLSRRIQTFFDEKNLLETTKNLDYTLPPVVDDATPGEVSDKQRSILEELFKNEKDEKMQIWYQQHYGKVYEHAMAAAKQKKMLEETIEKQKTNKKD